MGLQKRIKSIQQHLQLKKVDFALLIDRENLIYFTNIREIEASALIIPQQGEPVLLTLWLDVCSFRAQTDFYVEGYQFPGSNLGEKVAQYIKQNFASSKLRIGVGKYFLDFNVYSMLNENFAVVDFVDISPEIYQIRSQKDSQEFYKIKEAAKILNIGMNAAKQQIKVGATEVEILAHAEFAMGLAGSEGAPFRMQVLTGSRQLLTHPYAQNVKIAGDQTIVIHLGAVYEGYCAKMTRTFVIGEVAQGVIELYQTLLQAQQQAIKSLKPGRSVKEVYQAAYDVVAKAGYAQYFIDDIGHGVGIRQSEFYPVIGRTRPHFIAEGMVVDLMFPTIYHPQYGGARVLDLAYVTDKGGEIITDYPRDLIYLEQ